MFTALVVLAVYFGRSGANPVRHAPGGADDVALEHLADDDDATGVPALERERVGAPTSAFQAAAGGHVQAMIAFLTRDERVSRVEMLDPDGWACLHHAAYNDQLACVGALLELGANPDAVSTGECVPLHMAAASGSPAIVERLVGAGANPNLPDESGQTPLHYAAQPGRLALVVSLLAAGTNPDVKDNRLETALDMAERLPNPAVAEALREAGARRGADVRMAEVLESLAEAERFPVPHELRLPAEDARLERAREQARKHMPAFLAHLASNPESRAAVKFALQHESIEEFVWGEIVEVGQPLSVKVTGRPLGVPVPDGPVEVSYADVVDWQVELSDGKAAGGYTQRAMFAAVRDEYGRLSASAERDLARLVDL